jgi:transcriptional regulator with XRE-family HTH domain
MVFDGPAAYDRVLERRRAVALARHFREAEGLSMAQIAVRLGRSPATIKAYLYDPTGEKARAVKALRRRVPWLRRLHAAAQRQGRRVRVLQGLPPRRHRAALDPRARDCGDDRVAIALREVAVVL